MPPGLVIQPPHPFQQTVNPPYFQTPAILQPPTLIQPSVVPAVGHPQTLIQPGFPHPIYQRQPVVLQPSVLQNPLQPCVFYNQNILQECRKVRNIFCIQKERRKKLIKLCTKNIRVLHNSRLISNIK